MDKIDGVENYLYMKQCSLNLVELKKSCFMLSDIIVNTFGDGVSLSYSGETTMKTGLYTKYNVLLYPFPEFNKLYHVIKDTFIELARPTDEYYVQCWLNIYKKDEMISWHGHWPGYMNAWHGYYCVDTEPSVTSYQLPSGNQYEIDNKDNHIVIGKSDGDQHRTWPWPYADRPRITIAFDVVPRVYCVDTKAINHWVPL